LSWNGLLLAHRAACGLLPRPLRSLVALALAAQVLPLALALRRQAARPPGNAGLSLGNALLGQRLLFGPLPLDLARRHLVSRWRGALHLRRRLPALHLGGRLAPLDLRGRLCRPLWCLLDLGRRLLRRPLDLRRRLLGRRPLNLGWSLLWRRPLGRLLLRRYGALLPWRGPARPARRRLAFRLVVVAWRLRHHQVGRREAIDGEPSGHERRQHGAGQQQALCARHEYPCSATA
jgi:hypothetical protein